MNQVRISAATLAAIALLSGCATGPNRHPGDPLEPMNRAIFTFNDKVDQAIAVPIAKGYQKVTPTPLRTAISNFFSNIGDLGNAANNLLQLRITDATEDVMRVAMNSVFGIGGLIDFATPAGLPKHHQDFGLTLARWGVPSGPYLVLPIFGPSSFRDGIGRAVDVRFNLLNYIEPAARNPMYVMQFISARSDLLGASDLLQQAALDKYSFVRDAYTQQRRSMTYHGQTGSNPLPNYGDPGESSGNAPADNGNGGGGAEPGGLPQYQDPGNADAAASQPAAVSAPVAASMPAAPAMPSKSATPAAPATPPVSATPAGLLKPSMPATAPASN